MSTTATLYSSGDRYQVKRPLFSSEYHFSFGEWRRPGHPWFGALRVLNDDKGGGGASIPLHPHQNFEILSILLKGGLEHIDNLGNKMTVHENGVKLMSAGRGISHGGTNVSRTDPFEMLQVWIQPNVENTAPLVEVKQFELSQFQDTLALLASPDGEGGSLRIKQNAWISRSNLSKGKSLTFRVHDVQNGLYVFCLTGKLSVNGHELSERMSAEVTNIDELVVSAEESSDVVFFEVPVD